MILLLQNILRRLRDKREKPGQPAPDRPRPQDRPAKPGQKRDQDREHPDQDKPQP